MKNYLAILLTATTLLASCSTDDEKELSKLENEKSATSTVTTSEILGTWALQTPQTVNVSVKGTNESVASKFKSDILQQMSSNGKMLPATITFKSDRYCTAIEKDEQAVEHTLTGIYSVMNGRLRATLEETSDKGKKRYINCLIEKKEGAMYLTYDKEAYLFTLTEMLEATEQPEQMAFYKKQIDSISGFITSLCIPFKMEKK